MSEASGDGLSSPSVCNVTVRRRTVRIEHFVRGNSEGACGLGAPTYFSELSQGKRYTSVD